MATRVPVLSPPARSLEDRHRRIPELQIRTCRAPAGGISCQTAESAFTVPNLSVSFNAAATVRLVHSALSRRAEATSLKRQDRDALHAGFEAATAADAIGNAATTQINSRKLLFRRRDHMRIAPIRCVPAEPIEPQKKTYNRREFRAAWTRFRHGYPNG